MSKKTTLKHAQPDGTIATRQTARKYTHVLLRKHNAAAHIAALEATRDARILQAERDAQESFADHTTQIKAGVGGQVPYTRGQGGYGRNADGTPRTYTQEQWKFDHAVEYHKIYGTTIKGYLEYFRTSAMRQLDEHIAEVRGWPQQWQVVSWHSRADLAKPQHECPGDAFRVEAINNGVRS